MNRRDAGRKGGTSTYARHGSSHMEAIGREGFQVTLERYYGGDTVAYMSALSRRARGGRVWCERLKCWVA